MSNKIEIIETTLRDGSYPINFAFNSTDTAIICKELQEAGFKYIEVGHGVGLNASNRGLGQAAQTDEEYMQAADSVLDRAKYGMFCIPGIARLEDIDVAAKNNMDFIRIGTNVTEVESSKDFIATAKECGMFVTSNFMKSYALPAREFAQKVLLAQEFGTDMVYLVDSAGGMFNTNIHQYYEAVREVSDIPLGFHGHDNLSLALANSLEAINLGFAFVDSSLQGLGRSSGNAATETLVAALLKLGYDLDIDLLKVLDIGQKYVHPLITTPGRAPLDIISGFADFHSSYMHYIQEYATKYSINPALLIIEISKIDKVNVDEKVLKKVAERIRDHENVYLGRFGWNRYVGREQDSF